MKASPDMWRFLVASCVLLRLPATLGRRTDREGDRAQSSFTDVQCLEVVKTVEESGKYTEESIAPLCAEQIKSSKCDFFAEALSLASSHADFDAKRFCLNMEEARFCAESMDKLLVSVPVADLAYGECERAKPAKSEEYCHKFRSMLSYAVRNDDLDTIRACYMIQAYTNLDTTNGTKELETSNESPKTRIITSAGNELSGMGHGNASSASGRTRIGESGIVLKPKGFEYFGRGQGQGAPPVKPGATVVPPSAPPTRPGAIIVQPKPADAAASQLLVSAVPGHGPAHGSSATAARSTAGLTGGGAVMPGQPVEVMPTSRLQPPANQMVEAMAVSLAANTTALARMPLNVSLLRATTGATDVKRAEPQIPAHQLVEQARPPSVSMPAGKEANEPKPTVSTPQLSAGSADSRNGSQAAARHSVQASAPPAMHGLPEAHNSSATNVTSLRADHASVKAAPIVTQVVPLSPLAGHLSLRAASQQSSATRRAKTGLAQEGLSKVTKVARSKGKVKSKDEAKREGKGEYNGFLSKFVQ